MTQKVLMLASLAVACALACAAICQSAAPLAAPNDTPLWPGASYTTADRDRAVERALQFIYGVAKDPAVFRDYGPDLLFAFVNISTSNGNRRLAALAQNMGHERAIEWRREQQGVPPNASAADLSTLIYGSYNADRLGVPDRAFDEALKTRAAQFQPADYLGFDPVRESPPAYFQGYSRRALFMYALISTYFGEQFGTAAEGRYNDVLHWLPQMRPYPAHRYGDWSYYDAIYAVTHVVYTFNHYNLNRVARECFPEEFEYLKSNLPAAIQDHDPETLGEYVDSLRAFGVTYSDPELRQGTEYLLSAQNSDGSWGDPTDPDSYNRYHTTWTGLGAIQDFHWSKALPCPESGAKKFRN